MRIVKPFVFLVTVVAVAILTACTTVPETGRSQLLLIDPAQETQMGLKAFQDIKRKEPVVAKGAQAKRLRQVGKRIAKVVKVPHAQWEFVLFKDPDNPNAFALPGGKVGIYTGLLPIAKNDAGLATVMAHEIAHVTARHGAEEVSRSMLIGVGGAVLSAAVGEGAGGFTHGAVMQAYRLGMAMGVALPYSRTQESEADHLGLLYMAWAGYDPREAIAFWRRLAEHTRKRGGKPPKFLSTHPLDKIRIAQLQRLMPKALQEYRKARPRGHRYFRNGERSELPATTLG